MKKWIVIVAVVLLVIFAGVFYIRYYFGFGEGVKAGQLNYIVNKGYIFKTYEGMLIQSGFRSQGNSTIQSYEFVFSVRDKDIADSLMKCSGKEVELHYKEYLHPLMWRGMSEFVVDKIVSVE
ncbi:MAG: hypothetical protein LBR81_09545 [Prevotellaceae bacterium]|jgi:hypothetical protein|nr:hypothetical protein [Prevotellaceae bacterium]